MKLFIFCFFVSQLSYALTPLEIGDFKAELSGNLEAQTRYVKNSSAAKESTLAQDWNDDQFNLVMGNLNAKAEFKESRVEANYFLRHGQSSLYQNDFIAPLIINFPNKLVARDVFGLDYSRQDKDYRTDSVINKFYYELDGEDSRFVFGRMYINYGSGEIFNPINPFNQPLGLIAQSGIAQGNDGFKVSFFPSEASTINFYLLGDKRQEDFENQITRTLWIQGEYRFSESLQVEYVIGEDQRRNKAGGEISYVLGDGIIFLQALYSSAFINKKPSENLIDVVAGYDHQLTSKWHLRLEGGYQEFDEKLFSNNPLGLTDRFLPYEYFIAVGNSFELHPLVKLSTTIVYDIKTHFTYGIARVGWSVAKNIEWDLFASSPIHANKDEQNVIQDLITTDVGTSLRAFF